MAEAEVTGSRGSGKDTDEKRYSAIKKLLTDCSKKDLKFMRVGHDCPKHVSQFSFSIIISLQRVRRPYCPIDSVF